MKTSRELVRLGSVIGALLAAAALYWSHSRVSRLGSAEGDFARAAATHRTALADTTAKLTAVKSLLPDGLHPPAVPARFEEWSRQQRDSRAALVTIRQRLIDLDPALEAPLAPSPELVEAAQHARTLSGNLLNSWTEFEKLGSGLTVDSQNFAVRTLTPLIAVELEPALARLEKAEVANAEGTTTALVDLTARAQRHRLVSITILVISLGLLGTTLVPAQKGRLLSEPRVTSSRASRPVEVPAEVVTEFKRSAADTPPGIPIILLADPNPADSEILSLLIKNAGHAVITADTGPKALAAIASIQFHLVILNQQLAGKTGLEVLAEARRLRPDLPAIMVCGADDDPTLVEANGHRVAEVMRKPVSPRHLLWRISEIFHPGENRVSRDYAKPEPWEDGDPKAARAQIAEAEAALPPVAEPLVAPVVPATPIVPAAPVVSATPAAPAEHVIPIVKPSWVRPLPSVPPPKPPTPEPLIPPAPAVVVPSAPLISPPAPPPTAEPAFIPSAPVVPELVPLIATPTPVPITEISPAPTPTAESLPSSPALADDLGATPPPPSLPRKKLRRKILPAEESESP